MNFADVLWQVWLFYWFSAAFLGTLSAVFTAWGIRALWRKWRLRHYRAINVKGDIWYAKKKGGVHDLQ